MKPTTVYDLLDYIFFLQDVQIKTYNQKTQEEEMIWEGSVLDVPFYVTKFELDMNDGEGCIETYKDKIIIWVVE